MPFVVDNAGLQIAMTKIDLNIHLLSGGIMSIHGGTHKYARAQA